MDGNSVLMKINDAGFYRTASTEEYYFNSKMRNNVTLSKSFTSTSQGYKVSALVVLATRQIQQGEELYAEYGESFWYPEALQD